MPLKWLRLYHQVPPSVQCQLIPPLFRLGFPECGSCPFHSVLWGCDVVPRARLGMRREESSPWRILPLKVESSRWSQEAGVPLCAWALGSLSQTGRVPSTVVSMYVCVSVCAIFIFRLCAHSVKGESSGSVSLAVQGETPWQDAF